MWVGLQREKKGVYRGLFVDDDDILSSMSHTQVSVVEYSVLKNMAHITLHLIFDVYY